MDRRRLAGVILVSAGALSGCNEDALRPPPSRSSRPPPSSFAPSSTEPSVEAHSPAALSNTYWRAVARSPDAFDLYPLKGALLVDAAGFLAVLDDGPLRQSPAVMRGLERGASGRILGSYPDAAFVVAKDSASRWAGDRWVPDALLEEHETLLDLVGWGEGRAIAAIAMPGNDMRLAVLGARVKDAPVPLPSAPDPHATAGAHDDPAQADDGEKGAPCKVRMKPRGVALASSPSGELVAAGYACEPLGHGPAIVERWSAKQARGVVEALPLDPFGGDPPRIAGVVLRSAEDVFVYGSAGVSPHGYLAHFDGKAWAVASSNLGPIETLAAAEDGTLWGVSGGEVFEIHANGERGWLPLPDGLVAHAAWPRTATDVWVAARERGGKARAVLLRSAPKPQDHAAEPPALVRLPPRNAMAGMIATHQRFFATAACDKVFVELYAAGPSKDPVTGKALAPPKDFTPLKAILDGDHAAVTPVVEDDGARFLVGVPVPNRDVGRWLSAAYQDRNPGSSPAVVCHDPALAQRTPAPRADRPVLR